MWVSSQSSVKMTISKKLQQSSVLVKVAFLIFIPQYATFNSKYSTGSKKLHVEVVTKFLLLTLMFQQNMSAE